MPSAGSVENHTTTSALERWPMVGRRTDAEQVATALADPRCSGAVVVGGPGVGKSRLAEEVLAEVRASGRAVRRAAGSESARGLPLGALAHLLPTDEVLADTDLALDPVRLLAHARRALTSDSEGRPVLAIDDVHHLDPISATLLAQLAAEDSVSLLLTARSGERLPDTVTALQRGERVVTVELRPLPDSAVDTLLHLGLGGPVEGRTSAGFRVASTGNPLVLRELVRAARAAGRLVQRDGVWMLDGPMPRARQAADLLGTRLDHLDPDARTVVEVLALAGPTRLDVALDLASIDTLEALEAAELVELRPGTDADHDLLALAHPLLAEAVREQTTTLRARSILVAHADRVEAIAGLHGDDAVRVASWRLDAGRPVDSELLEHAAARARFARDLPLTARLAGASERRSPTLRAGILHGEALHQLGRWQESEAVFAAAAPRPGSLSDRVALALARSQNLLFGLMEVDQARAVVDEALGALDAQDSDADALELARFDLLGRKAVIEVYAGHPGLALELLGPRPPEPVAAAAGSPTTDERPAQLRRRAVWAMAGVPALNLQCRTAEAAQIAMEAYAEHGELGDDLGLPGAGSHLIALTHTMEDHGDLARAPELAGPGYQGAVLNGALIAQVWFALHLGRIALVQGHAASAARWFRESLSLCTSSTGSARGAWPPRGWPPAPPSGATSTPRPELWPTSSRSTTRSGSCSPSGASVRRGSRSPTAGPTTPSGSCAPAPTRPPPSSTRAPRPGSSTSSPAWARGRRWPIGSTRWSTRRRARWWRPAPPTCAPSSPVMPTRSSRWPSGSPRWAATWRRARRSPPPRTWWGRRATSVGRHSSRPGRPHSSSGARAPAAGGSCRRPPSCRSPRGSGRSRSSPRAGCRARRSPSGCSCRSAR